MSAMSNYLEDQLITHLFRTGTFTKPTTISVALCTAAPTDSDTGALSAKEVSTSSTSYDRMDLNPADANWAASSGGNGLTSNLAEILFPLATADWGTITHVAICDNGTPGSGNLLLHGSLQTSKVIQTGDQFRFNIGDVQITFA